MRLGLGLSPAAIATAALFQSPVWAADANRSGQRTPIEATRTYDAAQSRRRPAAQPTFPEPAGDSSGMGPDGGDTFTLDSIDIEGATAIPPQDIAAAYQNYLGRSVSISDLSAISQAITELYRSAGFSLSRAIIPPQDIANGRVRVTVLEGYIGEIVLDGVDDDDFGARRILALLQQERPLLQAALERQLLLVNDTPGLRIADTALEEMGEATGRFRLVVTLERWHLFLGMGVDNRGTTAVGRMQGFVAPAANSLIFGGDTLGLALSSVPDTPNELQFGRAFYAAPIGSNGARVAASATYGEIWPGDERHYDDNYTSTARFEIKGTVVPLRTRDKSLWLHASGDISDVRESDDGGPISDDHIRALTFTLDAELHDSLRGSNYLTAVLRQGLNILGASTQDDALLSREDGSGEFTVAQMFYTRYQNLAEQWSFNFSAAGQLASTALLAPEEFYLGGPTFGRAYDSGEISGENGLAASLEVRFDQAVENTYIAGYQLYAFADYGAVWDFDTDGDERLELASAGGGVRLFMPNDLQGAVELAVPLAGDPADSYAVRDLSIYFSLSQSFKACRGEGSAFCLLP